MSSSLMARLKATSSVPDPPPSKPAPPAASRPPSEPKPRATPESKSLIQQLIQKSSRPSSYHAPPPFFMCSEAEALDRQNCLELSPFECQQPRNQNQLRILSSTPQKSRSADATWDVNEIPLDTPTPKKSSLAAAAAFSSTVKSSYYSNHSAKSPYVPPAKQNNDDVISAATPAKPAAAIRIATPGASAPPPPTSTARKAARARPTFHPQLVIKKYRRSAAGGGVNEDTESVRTLDQLNGTVDYLMSVFERQGPPQIENENNCGDAWGTDEQQSFSQEACSPVQFSLCDTVNFIDDRLRAVQKDLVSLVGDLEDSSCNTDSLDNVQTKRILRQMQVKMARYNILTLYLLSNVPSSKYQVKFGTRALRTCLTCYLNLSRSLKEDYTNDTQENLYLKELGTQDEIMAYVAILHMSSVLRSEETSLPPASTSEVSLSLMEESGSGWGSLFTTFVKYAWDCSKEGSHSLVDKYPRWKWALELAASVQSGNYQQYFTSLERGPTYSSDDLACTTSKATASENARFLILARCCASHSLNLIRLAALRRYNHAFGKGEKAPIRNLVRLLRFQPTSSLINSSDPNDAGLSERTVMFCRDAGLPIIEDKPNKCFVVMKSAPIEISGDESIGRICNPGRSNDRFVFGTEFGMQVDAVSSLTSQFDRVNMNQSVDDWEECDGNDCYKDTASCHGIHTVRLDDNSIMIPPGFVLSKLVE